MFKISVFDQLFSDSFKEQNSFKITYNTKTKNYKPKLLTQLMNYKISRTNYSQLMSINGYSTNEYSVTPCQCSYESVICSAHPARIRKASRSLVGIN